jgi:UDPglucose 6-dehydrogenase
MKNITFIGVGKLGLCSALVFEKAGYNILGVDVSDSYVKSLNKKTLISHEPSVMEYLKNATSFKATTSLKQGLKHSDLIFIVVQTPNGGGENFYDHSILSNLLEKINSLKPKNKDFIVCCTTMPGYLERIGSFLLKDCVNCTINYNPEFIAQGSIIRDFQNPDIILIGEQTIDSGNKIQEAYEKVFINNERKPRYCRLKLTDAEIVKISINGYVTTKISYANMISDLCDKLGADKVNVLRSIGSDSRIGTKYFNPGYSFGGPCFPRDTEALRILLERNEICSSIIKSTREYNEVHVDVMVKKIMNNLENDNCVIEDICYKANSVVPIIEESAKLKIAKKLVKNGIKVFIKDVPHMLSEVRKTFGDMFEYIEK